MLKLSEIKDEEGGGVQCRIRVDMFINTVVEAAKMLSEDLKCILDNGLDEKSSPRKKVEILVPSEVNIDKDQESADVDIDEQEVILNQIKEINMSRKNTQFYPSNFFRVSE